MADNFSVGLSNDDFIADNLDEVQAWDGDSFTPVAPGDYVLEVESAERTTSSKGNAMIAAKFTVVLAGDGGPTPEAGRQIRGWYTLSGDVARKRLKTFVTATGVYKDGGYRVSELVGKRFLGRVINETNKYVDKNTMEEKEGTNAKVFAERALG